MLTAKPKQIGSLQRLRQLPVVFSGKQACIIFGWDSKTTSQYLWLWKRQSLVVGLGGHSDVFCNLVVDPKPHWEEAMLLACPSATVIGMECLRRAEWTTQIPARPTVAISANGPQYTIEPFVQEPRPEVWYRAIRLARTMSDPVMPFLPPAWALADILLSPGSQILMPAPDDIEWDAVESKDRNQWIKACKMIGGEQGRSMELLCEESYIELYDKIGPFALSNENGESLDMYRP